VRRDELREGIDHGSLERTSHADGQGWNEVLQDSDGGNLDHLGGIFGDRLKSRLQISRGALLESLARNPSQSTSREIASGTQKLLLLLERVIDN
jgi:hypothetical protein